jgi:hypothetical protein
MSASEKLVEHAFRRAELQDRAARTRSLRVGAAEDVLEARAERAALTPRPRRGTFRRVAAVVSARA